ncbi:MAG TPA: transcription antitermination factor NusB [Candidatus Ozemobacteraceae bacterium]|nr:transcription antitermination factor NusB [Candidatus Ozemobacteraceae bacterium]
MPSRRRKARETALKALYQIDLIRQEPNEAIDHAVAEDILYAPLEGFARELAMNLIGNDPAAGDVEGFAHGVAGSLIASRRDEAGARQALEAAAKEFLPISRERPDLDLELNVFCTKAFEKMGSLHEIEQFARTLVDRTIEHQGEIDRILSQYADNWTLERMASLDRCILRFATCELLHFPEIPVNVSINEAIELAKKFSTERSCEFVNGILDKVQRELKPVKQDARRKESRNEA